VFFFKIQISEKIKLENPQSKKDVLKEMHFVFFSLSHPHTHSISLFLLQGAAVKEIGGGKRTKHPISVFGTELSF